MNFAPCNYKPSLVVVLIREHYTQAVYYIKRKKGMKE